MDGVGEAAVTKPERGGGKGQDPLDRDPFGLDKAVISVPLLEKLKDKQKQKGPDAAAPVPVIIDLNLMYPGGRQAARRRVFALVKTVVEGKTGRPSTRPKTRTSTQYVYALLDGESITKLVKQDGEGGSHAIYHIWPDFEVKSLINKSISTVKADAAHNSFAAVGRDIVWAVVDSGIDGSHPHFRKHGNLDLPAPLTHRDFTSGKEEPLVDAYGHGTHVAGIIAGEMTKEDGPIVATTRHRDEQWQSPPMSPGGSTPSPAWRRAASC